MRRKEGKRLKERNASEVKEDYVHYGTGSSLPLRINNRRDKRRRGYIKIDESNLLIILAVV